MEKPLRLVYDILFRLRDLQEYLATTPTATLSDEFCQMVITMLRCLVSEFDSCNSVVHEFRVLSIIFEDLRSSANILTLMDAPTALQFVTDIIEDAQGIYDHVR